MAQPAANTYLPHSDSFYEVAFSSFSTDLQMHVNNSQLGLKATAGFIFKSFNPRLKVISQMMVCKLCRTFDVSTGDHPHRCIFQINSKQTDFQLPSNYNQAAMICWKRPHGDLFHSRPSTQATLLSSTVNCKSCNNCCTGLYTLHTANSTDTAITYLIT